VIQQKLFAYCEILDTRHNTLTTCQIILKEV